MKEKWQKKTDLNKSLTLGVLIGFVLICLSLLGLLFDQIGWFIGVFLGTVVELINIVLHFKGAEFALSEGKTMASIIAFFFRMFLVAALFVLCVLMDKLCELIMFKNSIWGALIGLGPMEVILITTLKPGKVMKVDGDK